jgi:hypothetical protein
MMPNPSQVTVTIDDSTLAFVHGFSAHHRAFPEVQGGGVSAEDAAVRLVELLSLTLDNVPGDWHREMILEAIEDVRAFAERAHQGIGSNP